MKQPAPAQTGREVIGMENGELPVGFSMSLAQNPGAMAAFFDMDETARRDVIARSRGVRSGDEMRALVDNLRKRS